MRQLVSWLARLFIFMNSTMDQSVYYTIVILQLCGGGKVVRVGSQAG